MKTKWPVLLSIVFALVAALVATPVMAADEDDPDDQEANAMFATVGEPYFLRIGVEKDATSQTLYLKSYLVTPDTNVTQLQLRELRNDKVANTATPFEISHKISKTIPADKRRITLRIKVLDSSLAGKTILVAVRTTPTSAPIGFAMVAVGPGQALKAEEQVASPDDQETKTVKSPIGVGRH